MIHIEVLLLFPIFVSEKCYMLCVKGRDEYYIDVLKISLSYEVTFILHVYWRFSAREITLHHLFWLNSSNNKMLAKATPENAIAFVKLSVFVSLLWPLSATATRWQVVRFKTLIWLSYINLCCLLVPMVVSFQDCAINPEICVKSIPILAGNIQCIVDTTICQLYHKQLQVCKKLQMV